ncbi:MAG: hypothetical protein U0Q07_12485 [Acidimicrobiales bacterium]
MVLIVIAIVAVGVIVGAGVALQRRQAARAPRFVTTEVKRSPAIVALDADIAADGRDVDRSCDRVRAFINDPVTEPADLWWAHLMLVALTAAAGRFDESLTIAAQLRQDPDIDVRLNHGLDHLVVIDLVEVGRFDEAASLAAATRRTSRCHDGGRSFGVTLAEVSYWRGFLDAARVRYEELGEPYTVMDQLHRALIDWDDGRRLLATDDLQAVLDADPAAAGPIPLLVLASMQADLGWADDASATLARVIDEPNRDSFVSRYRLLAEGRIARADGRLDEAIGRFEAARSSLLARELRPYAAEALAERGRTLLRSGDQTAGSADLLAAADEWRAMGCGPRADRLTTEATTPPPPRTPT